MCDPGKCDSFNDRNMTILGTIRFNATNSDSNSRSRNLHFPSGRTGDFARRHQDISSESSNSFPPSAYVLIAAVFAIVATACAYSRTRRRLNQLLLEQQQEAERLSLEQQEARRQEERTRKEQRKVLVDDSLVTVTVTSVGAGVRTSSSKPDANSSPNSSSNSCPKDHHDESKSRTFTVETDASSASDEGSPNQLPGSPRSPHSLMSNDTDGTSERNTDSQTKALAHDNDDSIEWHQESCAICLEPYCIDDSVSYSKYRNCAHAFHTRCIISWLNDRDRDDCPYCRGPYLQPTGDVDESNEQMDVDLERGENSLEPTSDHVNNESSNENAADDPDTPSNTIAQDSSLIVNDEIQDMSNTSTTVSDNYCTGNHDSTPTTTAGQDPVLNEGDEAQDGSDTLTINIDDIGDEEAPVQNNNISGSIQNV